jgi:hypothetical protein
MNTLLLTKVFSFHWGLFFVVHAIDFDESIKTSICHYLYNTEVSLPSKLPILLTLPALQISPPPLSDNPSMGSTDLFTVTTAFPCHTVRPIHHVAFSDSLLPFKFFPFL